MILRNRVWIDEAYLADADLSHGYGQARRRGLSRRLLCIAVAIDAHKNPAVVVCGHGKPSTKGIREAPGSHIAKGAVIVHDKERTHSGLVSGLEATSVAHRADVRDPAYLERMALVNNLRSWLKRCLWRFTGDVHGQHAELPQPVRVPLPGQPGQGQVGAHRKGGSPHADGSSELPQPDVDVISPVI